MEQVTLSSESGVEPLRLRRFIEVSVLTGSALILLLLGNVWWDERLLVSGVPLNPLLAIVTLLLLVAAPPERNTVRLLTLMILPLLVIVPSILWSLDAEYGATKVGNLVIVSFLSTALLISAAQRHSWLLVQQLIVLALLVLLILAFGFKLRFGLFDRGVPFLFNGPIVFARVMALAAIFSMFVFRGLLRVCLVTAFSLAVVWTASKGPVLAMLATYGFVGWRTLRLPSRLLLSGVVVAGIAGVLTTGGIESYAGDNRLILFMKVLLGGDTLLSEQGPLGARLISFRETLVLIANRPFGAGLGGWAYAVSENAGLVYPHNLVLELFSEAGILAGAIALIPFTVFLLARFSSAWLAALFFLVAQMVSGDLLDARYLVVTSILAYWISREIEVERFHTHR
ncbi:MAG: O-antigen ligase family protein [Pseudomonadota bacterium]